MSLLSSAVVSDTTRSGGDAQSLPLEEEIFFQQIVLLHFDPKSNCYCIVEKGFLCMALATETTEIST